MGEMASLWGYEENTEMEQLGQKLLYTTLELEKLKTEAMEEMKNYRDYINKLLCLLKYVIRERDEARSKFHNLLKTTTPLNDVVVPLFQPDTPLFNPNSSMTESNSLSDPYTGSSPVDSLFDAVSSPDFSNIMVPNNGVVSQLDPGSLIIDSLAKGRVLPQKGKLRQAVSQASTFLQTHVQTHMAAGRLPIWRNPPQLRPFQIPPVSIKADSAQIPQSFAPFSPQIQSAAPMLNFANLGSGNCGSNSSLMSVSNSFSPMGKRPRFG